MYRYRLLLPFLLILPLVLITPLASSWADMVPPNRSSRQPAAPDVASYRLDVRLDPVAKTVSGTGRITYRNPSQDTLRELWLRLYLRAFSSPDTVWMRESGGTMRGFAAGGSLGDIEVTRLALPDGADLLASTTVTDTLMRVPLPRPLEPGQSVELDTAWTSTLPRVFARTGYGGRDDTFFMVGQWYPKLAVYDRGRWDTEPWHARAEFFHDFGDYDVRVTVPREYVVAGAGVPAGDEPAGGSARTVRFTAESVTDFAFAASPDFRTQSARAGDAEVVLYYLPEHEAAVDEYLRAATGSLEAFSAWYGAYPYTRLTVVDVPDNAGGAGGMEYPTLITGGTFGLPIGSGIIAQVTAHEIAHQWWPMQTATDEAREPWLDEGLAEYSGSRYMFEVGQKLGWGGRGIGTQTFERGQFSLAAETPATLPAWEYPEARYGGAVYSKTALGLWTLEGVVGAAPFRAAMRDYLERYRWQHPTGQEFRASLERSLGQELDWLFDDFLGGTGAVDYAAGGIEQTAAGSTVRVERQGAVPVPVDVELTTASGARQIRVWDGREQSVTWSFPATDPVVRVVVDPGEKLKAELDRLDNGMATRAAAVPALTLGGRLAFVTQALAQLLGLFG